MIYLVNTFFGIKYLELVWDLFCSSEVLYRLYPVVRPLLIEISFLFVFFKM